MLISTDEVPCLSKSISETLWFFSIAINPARFAEIVLLPTPPFWLVMRILSLSLTIIYIVDAYFRNEHNPLKLIPKIRI